MPANMDIEIQRNAVYYAGWTFVDRNTKTPLDITDWSFSMQIKAYAGDANPPISTALINANTGFPGMINIFINGEDFSSIEGEKEIVTLAYDFLAKDSSEATFPMVRGNIFLLPGVSYL